MSPSHITYRSDVEAKNALESLRVWAKGTTPLDPATADALVSVLHDVLHHRAHLANQVTELQKALTKEVKEAA